MPCSPPAVDRTGGVATSSADNITDNLAPELTQLLVSARMKLGELVIIQPQQV